MDVKWLVQCRQLSKERPKALLITGGNGRSRSASPIQIHVYAPKLSVAELEAVELKEGKSFPSLGFCETELNLS